MPLANIKLADSNAKKSFRDMERAVFRAVLFQSLSRWWSESMKSDYFKEDLKEYDIFAHNSSYRNI